MRNILITTNCTHAFIIWEQPNPKELPINNYTYVLMLNNSTVESKTIIDHHVAFNLTTLRPNTPGYNFSVWANAPPGSGVKTSELVVAAQGMYIKVVKSKYYSPFAGAQTHNYSACLPYF